MNDWWIEPFAKVIAWIVFVGLLLISAVAVVIILIGTSAMGWLVVCGN